MRVKFSVVTLSILFLTASALGHSSWVGYSGAPGSRGTCASSCHGNPSPTYEVTGFPQSYLPGETYEISVVGLEGFLKTNFNSSCRLQGSSQNAGIILAGVNTETYNVPEETNGVHFISTSSYTGTFFWTAPEAGTGTVTLYFAGMQGDNSNGQNTQLTFDSEEEVSGVEERFTSSLPEKGVLLRNYPNPFNGVTVIEVSRNTRSPDARIEIFNLKGELVVELELRSGDSGVPRVIWDGTDSGGKEVASGVYLCRLGCQQSLPARAMILLR